MFSSLLRPKSSRRRVQYPPPSSSPYVDQSSPLLARQNRLAPRHATADFTETDAEDSDTNDEHGQEVEDEDEDEDNGTGADDEDGEHDSHLLPMFSAAHLDALPVYNLTHAIRLLVLPRTETTLTWDQLRSPQVSQFLVKPMLQQIRSSHFSRATLYALMANCLQFQKESQANPGNSGNSRTRAMVCELLAIRLLKEYNTRELIDALSYDFFPLQGLARPEHSTPGPNGDQKNRPRPSAARISTLEVAIRASAKHFLAHPLVVQQLEAIWAGTVVFHSAADNLHRPLGLPRKQAQPLPRPNQRRQHLMTTGGNIGYGTSASQSQYSPDKQPPQSPVSARRTVTIYDPRDASLFKLSRLRVPRYRQFFSTCSLAILLGLFLAVLSERSMDITLLEIIFWFWSAGFMLDEVVGFNEQGFSLYILSFWNVFDLGILLLLIIYYSMRLYGLFFVNTGQVEWNNMSYDVLATNAVLLFPRLFSVLDHYRYFSQLLIAFRLMAVDLAAVFVLILIACSGFFVAFTMSFGTNQYNAAEVAYKIFQMLMGFTPAAWEAWSSYNLLGKALLVLFLFLCHFIIVTILITVLTNSFMAIVSNANEEHQFVFAVNTISMVKNDALFSYIAPSNIFAWILTPLRFCLPFRAFIKLNRTVIKATHFPLLFSIYAYEKVFLARSVFEPTDLIDNMGRPRERFVSFHEPRIGLFSPSVRMRQDSAGVFQKDTALAEVFRLAPRGDTIRIARKSPGRSETHNNVNNWMDHQGSIASPPPEQDRSVVDRLEMRRQTKLLGRRGVSRDISGTRSVASDPAEFMSTGAFHDYLLQSQNELPDPNNDIARHSDADGDDELVTNDDDEGQTLDKRTGTNRSHASDSEDGNEPEDYFQTPREVPSRVSVSSVTSRRGIFPDHVPLDPKPSPTKRIHHARNISTNTILYNPVGHAHSSSASPSRSRPMTAKHRSLANTGPHTPSASGPPTTGHQTPRHAASAAKARSIMPPRQQFHTVANVNLASPNSMQLPRRHIRHRRSSLDVGMSDLGRDSLNHDMIPSSFGTQMAMATGALKRPKSTGEDSDGMMGRLLLARMKTLEEGFADVVKEFKEMRTAGNSSIEGNDDRLARVKGKEREGRGKRSAVGAGAIGEVNIAALIKGNARAKENQTATKREDNLEGQTRQRALS